MKDLGTRASGARLWWPKAALVLGGAEVLALLWFSAFLVPVDISLDGYLWQFSVLFGVEGRFVGVVPVLNAVNLVVVVGLWIASRSVRIDERGGSTATGLTAIAAAILLAVVGWWGLQMGDAYRPLELEAELRLEPSGEYRATPALER